MRVGKSGDRPGANMYARAHHSTHAAHWWQKAAAPAMTFPIIGRGGSVCAVEASAGGRVSRGGARFTQERTAQLPEWAARSIISILPPAARICNQASHPHAVRGPVNGMREGSAHWQPAHRAGAARRTTLPLSG